MVDVGKISGPANPTDPFSGKDNAKIHAEKFRKHIEETDTEQKKKQKKPQKDIEDLEDEAEEIVAARTQARDRGPADLKFPKSPLIKEVEKSDEQQKKQQKRPEESPPDVAPAAINIPKTETTSSFKVSDEKAESYTTSKLSEPPIELGSAEEIAPHPIPPAPVPIEEKEEPTLSPPEQKKEEKKSSVPKETVVPNAQTSPGPFFLPPPAPVTPGYASMKPELFLLFERMVMAIAVMNENGATETTIHLNSADFTIFGDAQLVIREYSTAPKAYNIEFLGNAQNTALFAQSAQDLVAAINSANYNFRINRIETSLVETGRPLFHRKESSKEKGEKDSQGDLK